MAKATNMPPLLTIGLDLSDRTGEACVLDSGSGEVIERFGRFPHRNAALGRKPTAMELAAGEVYPW